MDQGLAALLSAGVGLAGAIGGAAIGGLAAARGARIGAETAAKATAAQVQDQALADHEHWLRERRLEACGSFLAAYDAYAIAASNVTRALTSRATAEGSDAGAAFARSVNDIRNTYFQVKLVAPVEVGERARDVRNQIEEHQATLQEWAQVMADNGSIAAAAPMQRRAARLLGQLAELHAGLVDAVTQSVSRPTSG